MCLVIVKIYNFIIFIVFSTLTIDGLSTGTNWPLFNAEDMEYLLINSSNPVVLKQPYLDEFTFWNDLPILSRLTSS